MVRDTDSDPKWGCDNVHAFGKWWFLGEERQIVNCIGWFKNWLYMKYLCKKFLYSQNYFFVFLGTFVKSLFIHSYSNSLRGWSLGCEEFQSPFAVFSFGSFINDSFPCAVGKSIQRKPHWAGENFTYSICLARLISLHDNVITATFIVTAIAVSGRTSMSWLACSCLCFRLYYCYYCRRFTFVLVNFIVEVCSLVFFNVTVSGW